MIEQRPHGPSPIPEPQHASHEGGNGAPGIPSTLNERAHPPPEGQKSNALTPRSQEEERRARFYDEMDESFSKAWDKRGGFPLPPRGNLEKMRRWEEELEEVRREVLRPLTPEQRAEYDLEHLKRLSTMSGRIDYMESGIKPGSLSKLQQLDPEFMEPIVKGLEKRPARRKKVSRALVRILHHAVDRQSQREQ